MLPALETTLSELGIDLRSQDNVHLDLDVRPSKSPRAFCAPIDVPGKVMLVIQPIGGKDDWEAGIVETLLPLSLSWLGIALAPALLAVFAYRLINLWLPIIPALAGLPSLRRLERGRPPRRERRTRSATSRA